ncbi:MAG TPA: AAA family ATPase [Polyangiaceae bacterium]|nr:AAA family ATPase [Polyangiaceae bacterium]
MSPIFGRGPELARVESTVRRGLAGEGALLLLSGEPGIGKTLLAEHAAKVAAEAGAIVAWGRCWEAGGAPAYWPWIEAFRSLELDDPFGGGEAGESPDDARFRAFDRAVQLLLARAKRGPLTLVLDDLHAADLPSLLVLQLLARALKSRPVVVVGTYRDVEARRDRAVGPLLAKIAREGEVLSLARLGAPDVEAWLQQAGQQRGAAEVFRLTEGNPLFVREVLRLGGALEGERLPDGIGPVLDEHLARVSAETRRLLEHAAILGREFAAPELALLAQSAPAGVQAALSEAAGADLLTVSAPGRFSFVHMLVRDRLVELLGVQQRAELDYRAAEMIIESRADLISAAHHFIEGHTAGSIERVLSVVRDACSRCMDQLAFEAAVELGERAVALVPAGAPSRSVCALLVVLAEAHLRAGDNARGKARCLDAANMAKALGESDLQARAALAYGTVLLSGGVDPLMVELLDGALAQVSERDHPIRARLMARLSAALVPPQPDQIPRVMSLAREGIAMARRLNDPETLLHALQFGASGFGYLVSVDERLELMHETVELADRLGNRVALLQLLGVYAATLWEQGRSQKAEATYERYMQLLDEFPQPTYQWRRLVARISRAALNGDADETERAAQELYRLAKEGNIRTALMVWSFSQVALAHSFGDPRRILPHADEVLAILSKMPNLAPYTAWVLAAAGREAESRQLLRTVAQDFKSFPWLIAAGDAAVLLKASDLAELYYVALSEHRFKNRMFWGPAGALCLGPTARVLGNLAELLGRRQEALEHFDDAVSFCERVGAKGLLLLAQRDRERVRAAPGGSAATASAPVAKAGAAGAAAPSGRVPALRREGDVWALECAGSPRLHLKDGKGLHYLERLLQSPGQELHVLDLTGSEERATDAGALLDPKAKEQYRRRLEDLRDQLEEASRLGDSGRAERAQAEIDAIADALASAVGLGGRDRVASSNVERARINVQRRLRDALDRISEQDPSLGRYLTIAIKTGTFCSFTPV